MLHQGAGLEAGLQGPPEHDPVAFTGQVVT